MIFFELLIYDMLSKKPRKEYRSRYQVFKIPYRLNYPIVNKMLQLQIETL